MDDDERYDWVAGSTTDNKDAQRREDDLKYATSTDISNHPY